MTRAIILLAVLAIAACGEIKPGTPGHEPPSAGNVNPFTGRNSGSR